MSSSIEDLAGVLRSQPIQERAKKRIGLILQTAADVLEDEGVDGFNTNLIAERAGIPVSAIYIYFEDKFTILTALALRTVAAEVAAFHRFEGLADLDRDWREVLRGYSAEYARRTAELPGFVAIRKAISALPELRAVDRRADRTLARQFTRPRSGVESRLREGSFSTSGSSSVPSPPSSKISREAGTRSMPTNSTARHARCSTPTWPGISTRRVTQDSLIG